MPASVSENGRGSQSSALERAIDLLRGGLRPDGTYDEAGEGEVAGHQWRVLNSWCCGNGLIVSESLVPERHGGREHDVLFCSERSRWIKFTKLHTAGYAVEVLDEKQLLMLPATPLQYLERWKSHNSLFGDDVEFLGIKGDARLVISQRHAPGGDATWNEIEETFVNKAGMQELPLDGTFGGYESRAYFRGRVAVFDVRPQNCVRITGTDELFPIDVIPMHLTHGEALIFKDIVSGQQRMKLA